MALSTEQVQRKLLSEVLDIYTNVELKMLEQVKASVVPKLEDNWRFGKVKDLRDLRVDIEKELKIAHTSAKKRIAEGIYGAYVEGVNSADLDMGVIRKGLEDVIPGSMTRLVMETENLIDNTSFQILRNVDDAYRSIISETSTGILSGLETRQAAMQTALNKFAAQGITSFVDKAGRRWQLSSYIEMATRTTSARAALQGHIDRQLELGNDLIKISSIGSTCPICMPWQGKVLSISGKDPAYPSLDSAKSAGLFHPNCKHTVMAYFPEIGDGPPTPVVDKAEAAKNYENEQKQRYNERQIRYYKRQEAVAITPSSAAIANRKVRQWQKIQREHVEASGLKRLYYRESIAHRAASTATPVKKILPSTGVPVKPVIHPTAGPRPPAKTPAPVVPKAIVPKPAVKPAAPIIADISGIPTLENFRKTRTKFFEGMDNRLDSAVTASFDKASKIIENVMKKSKPRMRIPDPDTMIAILDSKFKNQMEIGTSRGNFNPSFRKNASRKMFGTPTAALDSDYELYGYFHDYSWADDFEKNNGPNQYGSSIFVEFKDEVRSRTTFTIDDSLGPCSYGDMLPSLVNEVTPSWEVGYGDRGADVILTQPKSINELMQAAGGLYVEAQYHGGLSIDDISSIVIRKAEPFEKGLIQKQEKLAAKLKEKGVRGFYVDSKGVTSEIK